MSREEAEADRAALAAAEREALAGQDVIAAAIELVDTRRRFNQAAITDRPRRRAGLSDGSELQAAFAATVGAEDRLRAAVDALLGTAGYIPAQPGTDP